MPRRYVFIPNARTVLPPDSDAGTDVWINVFLWILGWIPGVIHAWYPLFFGYIPRWILIWLVGGSYPRKKLPPLAALRKEAVQFYPFWARFAFVYVTQRHDNVNFFVSPCTIIVALNITAFDFFLEIS
jgi:hypothetical protein